MSTLQFQLNPKVVGAWTHIAYDHPPTIDDADNVDGDFDERASNKEGYVAYLGVEPRHVYVLIRAPGYQDARFDVRMPHDELVTVSLASAPLSRLTRIEGHRMVNERGEKVYGRGASAFLLYKKFIDGEDITPFLRQHQELTCNLLRIMGMFESLGGFNPKLYGDRYYQQIQAFCALCESFGIYVLWTACAATGGMMTPDEALRHTQRTADELRATNNPLFSYVNEQGQHNNSVDRNRFKADVNTGWMLYDTGSFGMDIPCEPPFGTHAVLHVNRRYSNSIRDCCILDHPNQVNDHLEVGLDEPARYGTTNDPAGDGDAQHAADAAGTAYTALYFVFHSLEGERANVLTGNTLDCATAAFAAMKGH